MLDIGQVCSGIGAVVSAISGLGVRELTFVSILTQYGVPAGSALMLSLVLFFRGLIFALVGGLYELKRVFPLKRGTKLT